jgi:hypothetical protein
VESSCELGNEPSGSIKCWELPSGCTTCGLSSGTQLHIVGWLGCLHSFQNTSFNIQYLFHEDYNSYSVISVSSCRGP